MGGCLFGTVIMDILKVWTGMGMDAIMMSL